MVATMVATTEVTVAATTAATTAAIIMAMAAIIGIEKQRNSGVIADAVNAEREKPVSIVLRVRN